MSTECSIYSFSPSRADVGWQHFAEDIQVLQVVYLETDRNTSQQYAVIGEITDKVDPIYDAEKLQKAREIIAIATKNRLFKAGTNTWEFDEKTVHPMMLHRLEEYRMEHDIQNIEYLMHSGLCIRRVYVLLMIGII